MKSEGTRRNAAGRAHLCTHRTGRRGRWAQAALAGCDWFVNTQVVQSPPNWDANHGRFLYNAHIRSDFRVMGLGWTQARAVMCLLAAHRCTGEAKYFEAARRGIGYAKILQNLDLRNPLSYGGFHEETPFSRFSYPRDAIEVADALMLWHRATGDGDALERAKLFFGWFFRNAVISYPGFGRWVAGMVNFDGGAINPRFARPLSCEMGCGTPLCHAYRLMRSSKFKRLAQEIADQTIRHFLPDGKGPLRETAAGRMSHHTGRSGHIYNDDGGGVALVNAWRLSGRRKYLDAARAIADFYKANWREITIYSGLGSVANFMVEMHRATRDNSCRCAVEEIADRLLELQVRTGPVRVRGAFRGEDEGAYHYVKGASNEDFVTTRVTAYAVLALFKLEGCVWPAGYSAEWR